MPGDPSATTFFPGLRGLIDDLGDTSWVTVGLAVVTLAVLFGVRRFVPPVPGPLVAVVLGILSTAALSLDEHGVALIAKVPSGLPTPVAPAVDHLSDMAEERWPSP